MKPLDPNDGRPEFQQVTAILRASIVNRDYEPGERLPSIPDMARHFSVARATVQKAVDILKADGLVIGRQGKGLFVRQRTERSVGLRPHIEQLFTTGEVSIDFVGFSGETLYGVLHEPLDKIRSGQLGAQQVKIRIIVPDLSQPVSLPALAPSGEDSPGVRARMSRIVQRSTQAIVDAVTELDALALVEHGSAQVRSIQMPPIFKLFLLNDSEAFFGYYPVVQHSVAVAGKSVDTFDPMGKDATLFHFASTEDPDSIDSKYVEESRTWFNSVWNSVAKDVELQ